MMFTRNYLLLQMHNSLLPCGLPQILRQIWRPSDPHQQLVDLAPLFDPCMLAPFSDETIEAGIEVLHNLILNGRRMLRYAASANKRFPEPEIIRAEWLGFVQSAFEITLEQEHDAQK